MSVPSPASAASNSFTILSYAAMALGDDAGITFGSVLGMVPARAKVSPSAAVAAAAEGTAGAEMSTGAGGGGVDGAGGGADAAANAVTAFAPCSRRSRNF